MSSGDFLVTSSAELAVPLPGHFLVASRQRPGNFLFFLIWVQGVGPDHSPKSLTHRGRVKDITEFLIDCVDSWDKLEASLERERSRVHIFNPSDIQVFCPTNPHFPRIHMCLT